MPQHVAPLNRLQIKLIVESASNWGLTVSTEKTRGWLLDSHLSMKGGEIMNCRWIYLLFGSNFTSNDKVKRRLQDVLVASENPYSNTNLSVNTKHQAEYVRSLNSFHNCCVPTSIGVSRQAVARTCGHFIQATRIHFWNVNVKWLKFSWLVRI